MARDIREDHLEGCSFCFVEAGPHCITQVALESKSSCLSLPNGEITGVHQTSQPQIGRFGQEMRDRRAKIVKSCLKSFFLESAISVCIKLFPLWIPLKPSAPGICFMFCSFIFFQFLVRFLYTDHCRVSACRPEFS